MKGDHLRDRTKGVVDRTQHEHELVTKAPEQSTVAARAVFGALPLLAAAGPLLPIYSGLFAFRLACFLIVLHAVVFLLDRGRWGRPDKWLIATSTVLIGSGVYGLLEIKTGADSPYSEFLAVTLGLATALAGRTWQRRIPRLYLALNRGWVIAGLVVCVATGLEAATGVHLAGHLESAGNEPSLSFGNPNALAVFVVLANVAVFPVRRTGGSEWRMASGLLVLATVPVLVLTDARLAMGSWLVLIAWSSWSAIRRSDTALATIGAALGPVGVALAFLAVAPRVVSFATEVATGGSSGNVREALSLEGLRFASQQWGMPSGPGSFEALMVESSAFLRTDGQVNAHNLWVEILVQYGALSLLCLLGWMIACVFSRSAARSDTGRGVVTLLVVGLVDSSLLDDAQLWLFVLTLAMASRAARVPPEVDESKMVESRKTVVP